MNNKKPPTSGHIKMTQGCIRAIAHLNIGMQVVFPLALSFTPMMVARAETGEKKFFAVRPPQRKPFLMFYSLAIRLRRSLRSIISPWRSLKR